ncbi:MAG TPA: DUF1592 domain-containing protein [Polyangiaceae bacterium]|nr:DUF1592 domain-containing protein [Polyangiaceae bacterium]
MVLLGALVVAGCIGHIGDAPSEPPSTKSVAPEPLHRLNRLEYNNTVRDLLAVSLTPADSFPPDNSIGGFDNMAEGLTLSPSLMDLYASAARDVARSALEDAPRYAQRIDARVHATATGQDGAAFGWGWSITRQGSKSLVFSGVVLEHDEDVTISILAGGDASGGPPTPEMALSIDGALLQQWTVTSLPTAPTVFSLHTALAKGEHTITVTFVNGYDQPAENVFNSLVVGYVDLASDAIVTPAGRALVYVCQPTDVPNPEDCYRTIVTRFAERAWRRSLTDTEAGEIFALWKELSIAEGSDVAVSLVVRGLLMSSKFLYRASTPLHESEGLAPLDDYALASRLSYFLWSSMPDDELFDEALAGALRDDEALRIQVERMLEDPKSSGLRKGFAAQWLGTRLVATVAPDPVIFPFFDDALRASMIEESELFFEDFLHNDRPIGEMMAPDFAYLDDRLAQHYLRLAPGSTTLERVKLTDSESRRGLLMLSAWLTATSTSTRTSPVVRGRWILEQLLCSEIPPPPPDVPPFEEPKQGATMRETLAEHRKNAACAKCHDLLDPAGLGMEEFDGIGARRGSEFGMPIDTSGAIPPGIEFHGAAELAALLETDRRFPNCLANKLFAYALGREIAPSDEPFLEHIKEELPRRGDTLDALIELIVLSPAFRMRDPEKVN